MAAAESNYANSPSSASSVSTKNVADHPQSSGAVEKNGRSERHAVDTRSLCEAGQKKVSVFQNKRNKKGPAPLASFEDISVDKTTSDSSSADEKTVLSGIGEESSEPLSPNSSFVKTAALTVPASPRIRVSVASSSSAHDTDSKDSTPDKELFIGYTKKDYCEEMSDVKTSTEELLDEEERARRMKEKAKQIESERYEEALKVAELNRKESSSSVLSEHLLPVASGHSSRLSSLGSIGSNIRRSPSPHKMLLETSFCGSKPIQQPSIDLEDPPLSSSRLINYTLDNLEPIKSPTEKREMSQSPPIMPTQWKEANDSPQVSTSKSSSSKTVSADSEADKTPTHKKSQFQERRDKIDQQLSRIHKSPRRSTPEKLPPQTEHRSRAAEYQESTEMEQRRKNESLDSPSDTSRSSRLGKKVLPPIVPDLNDLRRKGSPRAPVPPPPPPGSSNNSAALINTPDSNKTKSYSTTPTASPKMGRKYLGKKGNKDGVGAESTGSTPSTSRKSSFSSIFRRGDPALSPVTPDSPASISGRKSPFGQLIKSAKNEYRSRSRSRSRSKSRDRDLEDDTHDRRGVLSIFKPKSKKKNGSESSDNSKANAVENKSSEAIMNVEFTFRNEENGSSSPSVEQSLTETRNESVKSELSKSEQEGKPVKIEPFAKELEKALHSATPIDVSSKKIEGDAEKVSSYRTVIQDLEQKQKERAERTEAALQTTKAAPVEKEPLSAATILPDRVKDHEKEISTGPQKDELKVKRSQGEEDSRSESERESEVEYYKKKQQLGIEDEHTISSDVEIKKLVGHEPEEDELPYVPTTLPQERSQVTPMIPVRDRTPSLRMIQAIDRPRSTTPILPSRLEQYRESIDQQESESDSEKITVTIPNKTLPAKTLARRSSKSWEDFCQEGLRSPRTLRREHRDNSIQSTEDELCKSAQSTPQSVPKSPSIKTPMTPSSCDLTPLESPKNWINFEELPDIQMKPVRQIKTVPQKSPVIQQDSLAQRKPKLMQQKHVDTIRMNDVNYSSEQDASLKRLERELSDETMPAHIRSTSSTPERDDSSEKSSDSERLGSQSSSEELTTIREKIAEIKKREEKPDLDDSSDLERLLAPVNDCIAKLSSLSVQDSQRSERKSPIPDNWADFLLPPQPGRRSRLSSIGSDAGSIGGRSPSPSHMLLETSFCGSQPINDPGFEEPNVPIAVARKMSGVSLGDLSPLVPRADYGATVSLHHFQTSDGSSIVSGDGRGGGGQRGAFEPHHHRSASEYCSRTAPPAPPRRGLTPFAADLKLSSNRSSVASHDRSPPESPS